MTGAKTRHSLGAKSTGQSVSVAVTVVVALANLVIDRFAPTSVSGYATPYSTATQTS